MSINFIEKIDRINYILDNSINPSNISDKDIFFVSGLLRGAWYEMTGYSPIKKSTEEKVDSANGLVIYLLDMAEFSDEFDKKFVYIELVEALNFVYQLNAMLIVENFALSSCNQLEN